MAKRYNIGLLVAQITDDFSKRVAIGAMEGAKAQDVNLVIFPGKYVGVQQINEKNGMEYEYQYNVLFDLAAEAKLDYLIVAVGTIAFAHNKGYQKMFLDGLGDTPILSVAADIEGYDYLVFDNRTGVKEAVDYLAAHGRKHIGMIAGDLNNEGFLQRYEAYRKALEDNGLAYKESYMLPCSLAFRCYDEVGQLLDNNPELDAIVCATDMIAYDVYTVLEQRNLRPGMDIAVVGFDDLPDNARMDPPLASVQADAVEMGRRAVEKVVHHLRGEPDDAQLIETRFVPRRSSYRYVAVEGVLERILGADFPTMRSAVDDYMRSRCENQTLEARSAELALELIDISYDLYVKAPVDEAKIRESLVMLNDATKLKEDVGVDRLLEGVYVWFLRNCPKENLPYVQMLNRVFRAERDVDFAARAKKQVLQRRHRYNGFIRDSLMFGDSIRSGYAKPLTAISDIGAVTAFLYTMKEPIVNSYGDLFPTDVEWYFQAYSYGNETFTPTEEERVMTTPQVFHHDRLCVNRQHIFIVTDLFAAETQYGIALLEPKDADFIGGLELISYQLSSAVRTLDILRRHKQVVKELRATNQALEQLSRIDELTGVYNRKGFFPAAEALTRDPRYLCQPFMICFADMNSLKGINDTFGRAEGDEVLRQGAACLRYTFGQDAVIGRMGSDEFAAVMPVPSHENASSLNGRKDHFIKRFNESGEKPYTIGMTMAMFKCVCATSQELSDALGRADDRLRDMKGKKKD